MVENREEDAKRKPGRSKAAETWALYTICAHILCES